jgi:hypothetical protein
MATTRRYLDLACQRATTLDPEDTLPSINPIDINCLDPLGRNALLIG